MTRIARLPSELVDRIAAGEVVERPASIVKELVENGLDAGARSLQVEIEAGGKALISVRDDGCGMSREDAALCVERHATSKLRALADLQALATHGFRGEALSSIGSVSRLRLTTRTADDAAGTEVEVRHGRLLHVRDAGHPRGTSVVVSDLFGAVPARKKFLRADSTEAGHVAEAVTLLALARPDVGFTLSGRGQRIIEAPPVAELGARIFQLFGAAALERLAPVANDHEWARVTGFVARAGREGATRLQLRVFVNGRPIRDRGLARALAEGYRRAGIGEPRGDAFVFVETPPGLVDVNVHPAKSEVRFADARVVWEAVTRAVGAALSSESRSRATGAGGRVAEAAERYLADAAPPPRHDGPGPIREAGGHGSADPAALVPMLQSPAPLVLGQHRNTYIVASDGEELLLVDQHTAHERVRFERIVAGLRGRGAESQRLLVPGVVELAPPLRPRLDEHAAALRQLGFEIEPFGRGSIRIVAVPALLGARDPARALEALLRELHERDASEWIVAGARERLAATLACHSAARAGEPLPREQMATIVAELLRSEHPTQCPHGRPTFVRVPREELARWFGRSGWSRR